MDSVTNRLMEIEIGMAVNGKNSPDLLWLPQPEVIAIVDMAAVIVNRLLRHADSTEPFENRCLQVAQDALAGKYEGVGVVTG